MRRPLPLAPKVGNRSRPRLLRKMRHPTRIRQLQGFLENEELEMVCDSPEALVAASR
jgi:hypothetical protein